jgi:hypothetical protein
MPLQATSGAASYDAFGGGAAAVPQYIEDVFSTYLYTGNGSTQTITNGIDESGKGAMTWIKCRSTAYGHRVNDTTRGASKFLATNSTAAEDTNASVLTAFTSSGFSVGASTAVNENAATYASWTFRKQPKFFDVVTWSGNGVNGRNISHSLGSVPGCIIVKRTNTTSDWTVYHRSLGTVNDPYSYTLFLNTTAAQNASSAWNDSAPTSTTFQVSSGAALNASGGTYVAYLFAHDAGGFGLTGTDNVISCGSGTTPSSGNLQVNLGYEPQWILWKNTAQYGWSIADNMRGMPVSGNTRDLEANTSGAERDLGQFYIPNATGFEVSGPAVGQNVNFIYIAIRRGPMKVPTSGTSVYTAGFATATTPWFDAGFPVDMAIYTERSGISDRYNSSRLLQGKYLLTNSTAAEASASTLAQYDFQEGYYNNSGASTDRLSWMFKRAPSFFDEVCYTGTGSLRTLTHNLAAVPELIIVKRRSASNSWYVYNSTIGAANVLALNSTIESTADNAAWNSTSPTSTVFTVNTESAVNFSGSTYVAYLFATCAGVSKVGSYTGTAATKQIDCGFTAGARFVLIKRTDSTGAWYVWDTARGIIAGNDPYLLLNSTAGEVTNTDYIDSYSSGFELSSTAPADLNASGGTYIFLAIA